jgi:hypothetical protein
MIISFEDVASSIPNLSYFFIGLVYFNLPL